MKSSFFPSPIRGRGQACPERGRRACPEQSRRGEGAESHLDPLIPKDYNLPYFPPPAWALVEMVRCSGPLGDQGALMSNRSCLLIDQNTRLSPSFLI